MTRSYTPTIFGLGRDNVATDPEPSARILTPHCGIHEFELRGDSSALYDDPYGRIQAFMAVVTYLMMQPEFVQR